MKSEIGVGTDKDKINCSEYEEIENGNKENYHFVLQPRAKLNFRSFIGSRLVGLLPILWMGLFLNIPSWMNKYSSRKPLKVQVRHTHTHTHIHTHTHTYKHTHTHTHTHTHRHTHSHTHTRAYRLHFKIISY